MILFHRSFVMLGRAVRRDFELTREGAREPRATQVDFRAWAWAPSATRLDLIKENAVYRAQHLADRLVGGPHLKVSVVSVDSSLSPFGRRVSMHVRVDEVLPVETAPTKASPLPRRVR